MVARDRNLGGLGEEEMDDYVPVLYAESIEEAERYCQLLEDHDIPAVVDEDFEDTDAEEDSDLRQAIVVLAPVAAEDEARGLIAELEEMDDLAEEDALDAEDEFDEEDEDDSEGPPAELGEIGGDIYGLDEDEDEDDDR